MDNTRHYYFYTRMDAEDILDIIEQRVSDCKIITAYDVNQLCGAGSSSTDHYVGWTEAMIKDGEIRRVRDEYILSLPSPRSIKELDNPKISYREYSAAKKPTTTPEPISITIHTEDIDNIDATLAEMFSYISTIKDRMINLTIM